MSSAPWRVTVLGPQRRPTVGQHVREFAADGPIATVTAGWQEREPDDGELRGLLQGRGVNLALHQRWLDVVERDREYALAEREHRAVLDELAQLYLVQLDHALRAMYSTIERRDARPRTQQAALADALAVVHLVDERHLLRVRGAHEDFYSAWHPQDRAVVAEHREQVQRILETAVGLVLAGGHVGVLAHVLHLFHVAPFVPATVIAWSAGAMALTQRVVLFHDRAPHGPAHAEVYDDGLGMIRGVVLLPHARRRLRVEDLTRMSVLASRFAPASCVVLDDGFRVDISADGALTPGARVVRSDGRIVTLEGP